MLHVLNNFSLNIQIGGWIWAKHSFSWAERRTVKWKIGENACMAVTFSVDSHVSLAYTFAFLEPVIN